VHSDYDYSMVGVACLSRHQELGLDVLTEVLTSPAFAPDEVERRRNDILSLLERRKDDPVDRVRNRFIAGIYGDHPYRNPREGYPETVSEQDGESLRGFHRRFYRPEETLLAVVGDVRAEGVLTRLREALAGWSRPGSDDPAGGVEPLVLPAIPRAQRVAVEKIQKDGMTQATIRAGTIGISRGNPDYVPIVLLNYILGGSGFGSRLMKRLREERGLTYGVRSSFTPRLEPGYFFIECQTGLLTMSEALAAIFEEVSRMRDHGITQEELDWAVRYFSGSLPLTLQTNDQLATRILEQEFYGLEEEFWLKDIDRMRRATVSEVNEAARRYLHPEQFTVICLADFRQADLDLPPGSVLVER